MTVIAYDGTTLAADKMASNNFSQSKITKISRMPNGDLVGYAGEVGLATQFIHWLKGERKIEDFPESQRDANDSVECILIKPDRTLWIYERSPHPYRIYEAHYAIGSGSAYARAAMELGYDAVVAVKIACKLCPSCGLGYDKLTLK